MAKFSVCRIYKVTLWLNFSYNYSVNLLQISHLYIHPHNSQKYPRGEWGLGGFVGGKTFSLFSRVAEATQTKPPKQSFPGGEARERPQSEKRSRIIQGWLKD